MTAATANRITDSKATGPVRRVLGANSQTIYAGTMVALNVSGLGIAAATSDSNQGCVGVATEKFVTGTGGTTYIKYREGTYKFAAVSISQTDIGELCYAHDDQTIDESDTTNMPIAGVLVEVESSVLGWVAMDIQTARGAT